MNAVADVLMIAGASLIAIATMGLHRFDFYGRLHAASKATSAGFVLLSVGALGHLDSAAARVELAIAAILLVITTPVGVHLLARSANRNGDPAPSNLSVNEMPGNRKTPNDPDP